MVRIWGLSLDDWTPLWLLRSSLIFWISDKSCIRSCGKPPHLRCSSIVQSLPAVASTSLLALNSCYLPYSFTGEYRDLWIPSLLDKSQGRTRCHLLLFLTFSLPQLHFYLAAAALCCQMRSVRLSLSRIPDGAVEISWDHVNKNPPSVFW